MFGKKENKKTITSEEEKQYTDILEEARNISKALKLPIDTIWKLMIIQRLDKLNSKEE